AAAQEDLQKAREAARFGIDRQNMMLMGHDVVRKAVAAQKLAEQRAFQAALDAERKAHAEQTAQLESSIKEAQSDAERARLEAQQRQLQLNIEEQARDRAQKEAAEAAQRAAAAEAQARQAELQAQQLAGEKQQLANENQQLTTAKTQAELAAEQARTQLQQALSQVAETRETTRGLIVNLPDILFDFNKSSLRPEGREVLSKIGGILLVAKDYRMKLEGYTDIIGSDAYNLKLSQQRADSVQAYLIKVGIAPDRMQSVGFGKANPVASNTTAAGRQKNRRVEILIPNVQTPASGGDPARNR
ncbi:MAG: OmpA family protein, partial [Acidobacteriia bacterium]|nr:OmpA family protein [Terriglobia bacterium]